MDIKEINEFLGFKADQFKTVDEFKTAFNGEFVRTSAINEDLEPVKKIVGKLFGTLENEIKKVAKSHELEIDFDADEIKGKKVTDKLKFVFSKYDERNKTIIDDLTNKAGQGNDEKVKEWEGKYDKLKTKHKDVEELLRTTSEQFEGFKQTSAKEVKNVKLGIHKAEIFSKAKFIPEANEFTKKGFITDFEEKYQIDLDENEKPIIVDKKGQRIPNPKVTGSFFEPMELLTEEIIKAKLFPINKDGNKLIPQPHNNNNQQQDKKPQRQVASRMT